MSVAIPLETAPDTGRDEIVAEIALAVPGRESVATSRRRVADEMRLDSSVEGVVMSRELEDDATAANVGFQKGDIIVAVNGTAIAKTADLDRAARESAGMWRITLVRGGQQINVTLGG